MGHERVGSLPRARRWREVVAAIAPVAQGRTGVEDLAAKTLRNVRTRYEGMHQDGGVQAAFGFLVSMASSTEPGSGGVSLAAAEVGLNENPSVLQVVRKLQTWVRAHVDSPEYASLAEKSASDAIVEWARREARQGRLFATPTTEVAWERAATTSAFCDLSRLFFAKFTERYLTYFVGREAAAEVASVAERRDFDETLAQHLDLVSRHAFETAKITQSFSAGWYNKHAAASRPTNREIEAFLGIAFGKLREELLREAAG